MNCRISKYKSIALLVAISCLVPLQAFAAGWMDPTAWLTRLFGWQTPTVSHISQAFKARENNVKDNNFQRTELLEQRRAAISETASTSVATDTPEAFIGSESSTSMSIGLFETKRTVIVTELETVIGTLKTNASNLSDFIDRQTLDGLDMSKAADALSLANSDISTANDAINYLIDYQPDSTNPSDIVDLTEPETDLDNAITAIGVARETLKSAVAAAGNSLQ